MAIINLNSKAAEHVSCWICDHFQRYFQDGRAPNGQPCDGECRFGAPCASAFGELNALPINIKIYFPVITEAAFQWCSKFERSFEQNIPAPKLNQEETGCENGADLPTDWQWFWGEGVPANYWNKKILTGYVDSPEKGIACWNCDNWQAANTGGLNVSGQCRFNPPMAFEEGEKLGADFYLLPNWPTFTAGTCVWCSKWQRARHTVEQPDSWDCPNLIT